MSTHISQMLSAFEALLQIPAPRPRYQVTSDGLSPSHLYQQTRQPLPLPWSGRGTRPGYQHHLPLAHALRPAFLTLRMSQESTAYALIRPKRTPRLLPVPALQPSQEHLRAGPKHPDIELLKPFATARVLSEKLREVVSMPNISHPYPAPSSGCRAFPQLISTEIPITLTVYFSLWFPE
ncbi:hypothetical protein BDZ45DRAFT_738866 [Acephala macrosclerotiorum]|nr:hypothetical protein BDZ45DRAFT_738866 [Acephala macrosclerotiorum]